MQQYNLISNVLKLLHLRFFSNYLHSGHGFQLKYESTDVSHWTYSISTCGGNFTTPNGILTSPSFPGNYPANAECIYAISQPTSYVILLNVIQLDLNTLSSCYGNCCDYLEIRDGPSSDYPLLDKLCGSEIPASIQSSQNKLWMK